MHYMSIKGKEEEAQMNIKRKLTIILPVILVAVIGFGAFMMLPSNSLTMDVNPSIEIETNRLDRVVGINPLNLDAETLLKDFDPKDKNLEGVVSDLVDLMILTGHIKGGDDNIVMISVKDDSVDDELLQKVNKAISAFLENKQIEATILNQAIESSQSNNINQSGREAVAERISTLGANLSIDELSNMSLKQQIQYSKANNIDTQKLFLVVAGNLDKSISTASYISKEEATKIALDLVNGEIVKIELDDLRDDDDTPEYEIKIMKDGVKYEIEIDAYTGRVKEFESDNDDNYNGAVNEKNIISADEARKVALEKVNGEIVKFELDNDDDDDNIKYEIEIIKYGIKYELEVNAYTGVIIEFEREDDDDDDDRDSKPVDNARNIISTEQAKLIALAQVNGEIIKIELDDDDDDDNIPEYEIEIVKDGIKYELEIDAYTGVITEFEREDDDDDNDDREYTNVVRISADQAKKIALGLVNGTITEFEEDDDEFEIEIIKDGKEYEIEIDAYTGKVLEFEEED